MPSIIVRMIGCQVMGKQTRLDKYLADRGYGSRNDVKALIRSGKVAVNGTPCTDASFHVTQGCEVAVGGKVVPSENLFYYMLNKPAGWLSATRDGGGKVVTQLLPPEKRKGIFPTGRLDADTTGFLLLTNDGMLSHRLLSPARHVNKQYLALVTGEISEDDVNAFRSGIDIGEKKITLPAGLSAVTALPDDLRREAEAYAAQLVVPEDNAPLLEGVTSLALVTIHEGKFHQIRRMFQKRGKTVLALMRTGMGPLKLDPSLKPGAFRALTGEETDMLKSGSAPGAAASILDQTDAVLFDMDGTLTDSMWMWTSIDIEYFQMMNIPMPDHLQRDIQGMSFRETAQYFKTSFNMSKSVEEIMQDWTDMAREKYKNEVPLKPGAREFLDACRQKGIPMAIATSNHIDLAMEALCANRIADYFGCILTASDVGKGKPSPDIYLEAARRLGATPQRCLVCEDVPMGILAGKRAGMKVAAMQEAYCADQADDVKRLADYYITDFRQLLDGTFEACGEQSGDA